MLSLEWNRAHAHILWLRLVVCIVCIMEGLRVFLHPSRLHWCIDWKYLGANVFTIMNEMLYWVYWSANLQRPWPKSILLNLSQRNRSNFQLVWTRRLRRGYHGEDEGSRIRTTCSPGLPDITCLGQLMIVHAYTIRQPLDPPRLSGNRAQVH
jgi:hypothetical protein